MKLVVVLLALVFLVWLLFGRAGSRGSKANRAGRQGTRPLAQPEGMVRCAHCGVHLPAGEALLLLGRSYCSEAHRAAGPLDR